MDELSPLFQDIEFHERFRGYDPDEVDAYVDRIARAAAAAQARMRTLQERLDATEERLAAGASSETEETLTRTLVLAQRTADTAVAEAREQAEQMRAAAEVEADATLSGARAEAQVTLREARVEAAALLDDATARAESMIAEAEARRRALVDNAEAVAAEAASAERTRLTAELQELQEFRAFLSDDIEILERHLSEQRHQLAVSLSTLTDLLDSPEIFRRATAPATSGVDFDADLLDVAEVAVDDLEQPDQLDATAHDVADDEPVGEPVPAPMPAPRWVSAAEQAVAEEFAAAPEPAPAEEAEEAETEAAEEIAFAVVLDDVTPSDPADASSRDLDDADDEEVVESAFAFDPDPVVDLDEIDDAEIVEAPLDLDEIAAREAGHDYIDLDAPAEAAMATLGETGSGDMRESVGDAVHASGSDPVGPPRLVTVADLDPAGPGPVGGDDLDPGLPTAPVPTVEDQSLFSDAPEDSFLAQLRDAVAGDAPAPDDDEALAAFFDQEEDDGTRSWFGRHR